MTTTAGVLEWAMRYASYGWRVIPLYGIADGVCQCKNRGKCKSAGKHPRHTSWHKAGTTEEDVIAGWWDQWPEANIGIVMGADSDLMDFEYDSEEGKTILLDLFGGEFPHTPSFRSWKSEHFLFRYRRDLLIGANVGLPGVDLKLGHDGAGSQSVFPPSRHLSEPRGYRWVVSPEEWPVLAVPDEVVVKLANLCGSEISDQAKKARQKKRFQVITQGVGEGTRNQSITSVIGSMLRQASDLEDENHLQTVFAAAVAIDSQNKPPLGAEEVKRTFESILRKEGRRRITEAQENWPSTPEMKARIASGEKGVKDFRIVIIKSKPRVYELFFGGFKNDTGSIRLSASDILVFSKLQVEALEQADYIIHPKLRKSWMDNLMELVANAEKKAPPPGSRRDCAIAEQLLGILSRARELKEGERPAASGRPCKLDDGSVAFGFEYVYEEMSMSANKVKRQELSDVAQKFVAARKRVNAHGGKRMHVIGPEQLRELSVFSDYEIDG